MPKPNNNLVCTRIKDSSKLKLEFIKAYYAQSESTYLLSKSDYSALELLIDIEHNRVINALKERLK